MNPLQLLAPDGFLSLFAQLAGFEHDFLTAKELLQSALFATIEERSTNSSPTPPDGDDESGIDTVPDNDNASRDKVVPADFAGQFCEAGEVAKAEKLQHAHTLANKRYRGIGNERRKNDWAG